MPFTPAHVELAPVAFVPEIRLHQASESVGLWATTDGEYRSDQPPPFWAFAWPGGQALARHVLDHPALVAGRDVLDLAAGSGIVAIAAALAGAARVRATEVDPDAVDAISRNAAANGVAVTAMLGDILDRDADGADVVLAGDVFYSQPMADRVMPFLRRAARAGATVVVGDPGRGYFPHTRFRMLHSYEVPTRPALEDRRLMRTNAWELRQRARPA